MKQIIPLAVSLVLAFGALSPVQADSQLQQLVALELRNYAPGVDPASISNVQLGQIYTIIHSPRTESDKRSLVRSTIGGPDTLRGLFGLNGS